MNHLRIIMKLKAIILGTLSIFSMLLIACQAVPVTPTPVFQKPNKIFRTTAGGSNKLEARTIALKSATIACQGKDPIIIADNMSYNGILNEDIGRVVDKTAKIASAIFGSKTPKVKTDDTYEYTISFKCK